MKRPSRSARATSPQLPPRDLLDLCPAVAALLPFDPRTGSTVHRASVALLVEASGRDGAQGLSDLGVYATKDWDCRFFQASRNGYSFCVSLDRAALRGTLMSQDATALSFRIHYAFASRMDLGASICYPGVPFGDTPEDAEANLRAMVHVCMWAFGEIEVRSPTPWPFSRTPNLMERPLPVPQKAVLTRESGPRSPEEARHVHDHSIPALLPSHLPMLRSELERLCRDLLLHHTGYRRTLREVLGRFGAEWPTVSLLV